MTCYSKVLKHRAQDLEEAHKGASRREAMSLGLSSQASRSRGSQVVTRPGNDSEDLSIGKPLEGIKQKKAVI